MEKVVLTITGMRCERCVEAISTAVHALPGVSFVNVCLEASDVIVRLNPHLCTMDTIRATIERQGYQVQ